MFTHTSISSLLNVNVHIVSVDNLTADVVSSELDEIMSNVTEINVTRAVILTLGHSVASLHQLFNQVYLPLSLPHSHLSINLSRDRFSLAIVKFCIDNFIHHLMVEKKKK